MPMTDEQLAAALAAVPSPRPRAQAPKTQGLAPVRVVGGRPVRRSPEPVVRPDDKSAVASWTINVNLINAVLIGLTYFAVLPSEYQLPVGFCIAIFTIWDRYRKSDIRKGVRSWLGLRAAS